MTTLISRIVIENYRSIRHLELKPGPLCALVGPNNSGKSNILKAVALLLGRENHMPVGRHDYCGGELSRPVRVSAFLSRPFSPHPGGPRIYGLSCTASCGQASEAPLERVCLDEAGRPLPLAGPEAERTFRAVRETVPFFLIDTHRDFSRSEGDDRWNRLRGIFEELGGVDPETRQLLDEADRAASFGYHSRLLVQALKSLKRPEGRKVVLAVEEPEMFLHPHRERYFSRLLRELADAGHQVLFATHSSNFVDIRYPEDVCVVRRRVGVGTTVHQNFRCDWSDYDRFMLMREMDARRNDLFFSRGVMLVEGDTERFLYPEFLRRQGIDVDEAEISVVEAGGKGNMPLMVEMLEFFRIPYVAVFDSDMRPYRRRHSRDEVLRRLLRQGGPNARLVHAASRHDRLFVFQPNIETDLGFNRDMKDKVAVALQYVRSGVPARARQRLMEPVDKLLEQIREIALE